MFFIEIWKPASIVVGREQHAEIIEFGLAELVEPSEASPARHAHGGRLRPS